MDDSNPLRRWIQLAAIGAGLFLAGALLAFVYSYRPLHGSMTWKVDELERRLDERNLENLKMSDELARLRSEDASRIDPDTFSQVERELEKTKKALGQAEKDLKRAERKRKDANASASRWRKRFEQLRDQPVVAAPAPEVAPEPAPSEPPGAGPATPATAAPNAADAGASTSPAPSESGMLQAGPATSSPAP